MILRVLQTFFEPSEKPGTFPVGSTSSRLAAHCRASTPLTVHRRPPRGTNPWSSFRASHHAGPFQCRHCSSTERSKLPPGPFVGLPIWRLGKYTDRREPVQPSRQGTNRERVKDGYGNPRFQGFPRL